jgi:hypothetical protein
VLSLGEVDPQLTPGAEAIPRREDVFHLLRTVSRVERAVKLSLGHAW